MKSHEFCYWLQGYFELRSAGKEVGGLDKDQVDCIAKHLALVFKHEIDPKYGDEAHQQELNDIHTLPNIVDGTGGGGFPSDTVFRC